MHDSSKACHVVPVGDLIFNYVYLYTLLYSCSIHLFNRFQLACVELVFCMPLG